MKNKTHDEARRLAAEATGPLAHFIHQHLEVMVEQGYVGRTVYVKTYRAVDFDRWLEMTNIPLSAVDERCVSLYHQHRSGLPLRPWHNELRFMRKRCPDPTYPAFSFHARDAASELDGRLVWEFLWRSELSQLCRVRF